MAARSCSLRPVNSASRALCRNAAAFMVPLTREREQHAQAGDNQRQNGRQDDLRACGGTRVGARIGQQSLGADKPYGGDDRQRNADNDESETLILRGRTRQFFEPRAAARVERGGSSSVRRKRSNFSNNEAEGDDRDAGAHSGEERPFVRGVIGIAFNHETPPWVASRSKPDE